MARMMALWAMCCALLISTAALADGRLGLQVNALAAGKQLFETAEATCERMAACVDNFRIRQNQVNQTDVAEIVGHFIDEKWFASSSLYAGALEIFFP